MSNSLEPSGLRDALESLENALHRLTHERLSATSLLGRLVDQLDSARIRAIDEDPFQRDPEFIANFWPFLKLSSLAMGCEVRGFENLPKDEPVLIVGNHSGGMMTLDPIPLITRWIEARGCEAPISTLTYDLLFEFPLVGSMLRRFGCLPASHDNARRALDKGASVIVFPGGDYEVFRPWSERNKICLGGRSGFIELALAAGVRVVPMTIHGAHETTWVLTRGHRLSKALGLHRLRVKVFPVLWNIPFGPAPAFIPSLPIPSKMTVELGEPIDWTHHGPDAADDPEIVDACYEEIVERMQQTLSRLAEENPHPVLSRLNSLRPSRIISRAMGR